MNYKEVLKCLKMPNYVSNDFYSMLFARSIGGAAGYDELTGTPPLTFTANGRNLINYRIYGANDGVGEQTENLFDENYTGITSTSNYKPIYVGNGNFTLSTTCPMNSGSALLFLLPGDTSSGISISSAVYFGKSVTVQSISGYVTVAYRKHTDSPENYKTMLIAGSTVPAQYIPYGYQINAEVGDGVTTTDIPIYIGNTPLAQGEYVDYGEQKVYKYIGGVLTPTEPPVALPALPTIDGKTIVDFDNTPKPSEMYIKYPK